MIVVDIFYFTCQYCDKSGKTSLIDDDQTRPYEIIRTKNINELSQSERVKFFAGRSLHIECFEKAFEELKDNLHAGSYVSNTIFDDDEYKDVFVFQYVHKVFENTCEVWTINTSSRYVRKGGDFLTKEIVPFEDAIAYMFVGYSNDAKPSDLRDALNKYWKRTRRDYLLELVSSETESLMDSDSFIDYSSIHIIEHFKELFDDISVFEHNASVMNVLGN